MSLKRQHSVSSKKVKEISRLDELFLETNKENILAQQLNKIISQPHPILTEDDLSVAIRRSMCFGETYTMEEICNLLNNSGYEAIDISRMISKMNIEGMFVPIPNGSVGGRIYKLKQQFCLEIKAASKPNSIVAKLPKSAVLVTKEEYARTEPLSLRDGLDRCIWKVTSDRKTPLTVMQIAAVLEEIGFDNARSRNRVTTLMKRKWFDHGVNDKRNATYVLKKGMHVPAKMEETGNTDSAIPPTGLATDNNAPVIAFNISTTGKDVLEKQKTIKPILSVVHKTPLVNDQVISIKNGLTTCIWDIMKDYNEYTVDDIRLLLMDYGVADNSIPPCMSTLNKQRGWFTVVKRVSAITGRNNGYYTLKRNIPRPVGENMYSPKRRNNVTAPVSTLPSATVLSDTSSNVQQKVIIETPIQTELPEAVIEVDIPLIKLGITIKDTPYTFSEAEEMFGKGNVINKTNNTTLIKLTAVIKGISFTGEELKEISMSLITAGFGNK